MTRAEATSLGIAVAGVGEGWDALLRRADEALDRAKRNGRDRVELASPPAAPPALVSPLRALAIPLAPAAA